MTDVKAFPLQWPPGFPRWKGGRSGGAVKTDFDNVRKEIEKKGCNPREMLKVLKHAGGGEFITQLEAKIKQLQADPKALIDKIKQAFEAWKQKLKEISEVQERVQGN